MIVEIGKLTRVIDGWTWMVVDWSGTPTAVTSITEGEGQRQGVADVRDATVDAEHAHSRSVDGKRI